MKKILVLFLAVMILGLCSCNNENAPTTTSETITSDTTVEQEIASTASTTEAQVCEHSFEFSKTITKSGPFTNGEDEYECSKCGEKKTEASPTSIKILAIGNSFSVDAMEYLYNICADAGIENIVLGNLYIGGCSLDKHWQNIKSNTAAYEYYKNTDGKWISSSNSIAYAVSENDWDYITLQQVSQSTGVAETYGKLDKILSWLEENRPNDCKIYWHMTWAYQQNSTHSGFPIYQKDQETMYNAIIQTVNDIILPNKLIDGVIPSGTTVQNMRTSSLGDTLTRDGYHMTYDYGRYAMALTWFAKLTGGDIYKIEWVPEDYKYIKDNIDLIRESVANAIKEPFKVTGSSYKSKTSIAKEDLEDVSKYTRMNIDLYMRSYYNSSSATYRSTLITKDNSSYSNLSYFAATPIFTKEELPIGSVIVVDKGYQYRPEGWTELNTTTSPRPDNVSEEITVVTEEWWSRYSYRAFNFSYIGSRTAVSEADTSHFRIYIPVE